MGNLNERFDSWSLRDGVHLQRQVILLGRHVSNLKKWSETFSKYPFGSVEFKAEIVKLHNELCGIFEETKELCEILAEDKEELKEIFDLFAKEVIEKLPDE